MEEPIRAVTVRPMHYFGSSQVCAVPEGAAESVCGDSAAQMQPFPLANITCRDCLQRMARVDRQ